MDLSRQTLQRMFPRAKPEVLDAMARLAPSLCVREQITTPRRWVHFCGQITVESGGLRFLREIRSDASAEEMYGHATRVGRILGNTEPGDGARFPGRGLLQTTGRDNYTRLGERMGLDLVGDPALLERPDIAVTAAFTHWGMMGVGRLADGDNVTVVTKRINGGKNGLPEREIATKRAKAIWGNGMLVEPLSPSPAIPDVPVAVPMPSLPDSGIKEIRVAPSPELPPPVVTPAAPPVITPRDLVKGGSRTARLIRWLKGLIGLGTGTSILGVLNPFMITSAKDTTHAVAGLFGDPVALAVIGGGCGVVFVVLLTLEHFHVLAAINGRYVPSGWVADVSGVVADVIDLAGGGTDGAAS